MKIRISFKALAGVDMRPMRSFTSLEEVENELSATRIEIAALRLKVSGNAERLRVLYDARLKGAEDRARGEGQEMSADEIEWLKLHTENPMLRQRIAQLDEYRKKLLLARGLIDKDAAKRKESGTSVEVLS